MSKGGFGSQEKIQLLMDLISYINKNPNIV